MKLFVAVLISLCLGWVGGTELCSIDESLLNDIIDNRITATLANQPIIRMLQVTVFSSRTVELRHFSGSVFSLDGTLIDSISLSDPAIDVSSTYLAYRPNYNDFHSSGLAGMFINMAAIYPCITNGAPVCRMFTLEEDGFNDGRAFIEAGEIGNNFRIFSTTTDIATYGFAIQDCTQMDTSCLPNLFHRVITCLLPREQCS